MKLRYPREREERKMRRERERESDEAKIETSRRCFDGKEKGSESRGKDRLINIFRS